MAGLYGSQTVTNLDLLKVPIEPLGIVDQNGNKVGNIDPTQWSIFIQTLSRVTNNNGGFSSGSGVNYVPANYSQFSNGSLPDMSGTATITYDTGFSIFGDASLKVSSAGTVYFASTTAEHPFSFAPNQEWIISAYVKASSANLTGVIGVTTPTGTYTVPFTTNAVAGDVSRVYGVLDLSADTSTQFNIYLDANSGTMWFDGFMLEPQVGSSDTPSPYSTTTPSSTSLAFVGAWNSAATYRVGLEVTNGGNYWLSLIANTNSTPSTSNSNWQLVGPVTLDSVQDGSSFVRLASSNASGNVAYNYKGVWSSVTTYVIGDEVIYGPEYWICTAANTNSVPAIGNANWQVVGSYSGFLGAWSSTVTYAPGAEVTYNGNFWICVALNSNSAPATSNSNWQLAGPTSLQYIADGSTRFAAAQAGADVTALHTAADTTKVNGVLSTSISPIAELMPAQAGADVTGDHTSALTASLANQTQDTLADGTIYARGTLQQGNSSAVPIDNANFQLSTGASPTANFPGWELITSNTSVDRWTSSPAPAYGSQCLAIVNTYDGANTVEMQSVKSWTCIPGDIITVGGTVNAISNATTTIQVIFLDMNGNGITQDGPGTATPGWYELPPMSLVAPALAVSYKVRLIVVATGLGQGGLFNLVTLSTNDSRQPNSAKSYINANDTTAGGHQGFTSYTSGVALGSGIQVGPSPIGDGTTVTFSSAFASKPVVIFGDGGVTYDPSISGKQYQAFSPSFTYDGSGNCTGFVASLKINGLTGTPTPQSVNFTSNLATLTVPAGSTIVGGALTVNGSVTNASTQEVDYTITVKDNSTGTVLDQWITSVSGRSSLPFSRSDVDSSAVNDTVIGITSSPSGAIGSTVTYSTATAPASNSATPTGTPGINWAAFATS